MRKRSKRPWSWPFASALYESDICACTAFLKGDLEEVIYIWNFLKDMTLRGSLIKFANYKNQFTD
jgi:hypothetical protein